MSHKIVPTVALATVIAGVCPAHAEADGESQVMDPDKPVQCYRDGAGVVWRVQCDEGTRICLYAPNSILDAEGKPERDLERARYCRIVDEPFDLSALAAQGYRTHRGVPDAPHGWQRDERARVFQVNFDLKRRMYIGAGYAPLKRRGQPFDSSRASIDFGLLVFEVFGGDRNPTRHRLRLVEGEAFLAPFSGNLLIGHYDVSRRFENPLVRVTTFFGKPRRSDLKVNLGFWAEAGEMEMHHIGEDNRTLWKVVTTHATVDLWQSRDLYSFARIRGGVGVDRSGMDWDYTALTPGAAVEADITLDDNGFHHVSGEVGYERPIDLSSRELAQRRQARLQYEVVFLALNDQPLSLRLGAGAERRDDIPGLPDEWAFRLDAGLRFSLWAPPRAR